jgi:hypothetical protein
LKDRWEKQFRNSCGASKRAFAAKIKSKGKQMQEGNNSSMASLLVHGNQKKMSIVIIVLNLVILSKKKKWLQQHSRVQ